MTTDTHPKEYAVSFPGDELGFDGVTFTVGGMSKGSGMIMPNMATMIAIVTTDAPHRRGPSLADPARRRGCELQQDYRRL